MSAASGRRVKAHKKKKHHISHFKLLFRTALCGTHIFPVCLPDNAYVFYLTQQVLGICTFIYVNHKMGFLFKIGIFTLFYAAKW